MAVKIMNSEFKRKIRWLKKCKKERAPDADSETDRFHDLRLLQDQRRTKGRATGMNDLLNIRVAQ